MMKIQKSFSARISLIICGIVGVFYLITTNIIFYNSYNYIKRASTNEAQLTINKATSQIEYKMNAVSKSVDNIKLIVQENNLPIDTLYAIVRNFVANNSDIIGSAIAFEPNFFKSKGLYFSPYASVQDGKVLVTQLGSAEYDYFTSEWYLEPKLSGSSYWSKPYFDKGGANSYICTYSSVMRDKDGNFMGVVTADVSLEWLGELMCTIQPYPHSYTFAFRKGNIQAGDSQEYMVFNESIYSESGSAPSGEEVQELAQQMVNSIDGVTVIPRGKNRSYIFDSPITQTGWYIAVVNTFDDIFAPLTYLSIRIICYNIIGLILIFICCLWIIKKISSPLQQFAHSATEIAHGNFSVSLPVINTQDELKILQNSFEYMKEELVRYIGSLQDTVQAKERIESELRIARDIQMGMIPKIFPPFPERNDIDVYATLRPAKEVGGDLYDFFIHEEKLYFAIGDVSGKGVPASLFMAVTRSLFRSVATTLAHPKTIVESMNSAIAETNDHNMFVTLFIGILDLKSGHLCFCNAGHNPPCIKNEKGEVAYLDVIKNLPVGVFNDFTYQPQEIVLSKGDTIFLYTDGLTEAENSDKKLYGEEKLIETLNSVWNNDAETLLRRVTSSVELHVVDAPQSDDLTMMVINYFGHEKSDNKNSKRLVIKNQVAELNKLTEFIDGIGEEADLSPALTMSLNLAMEEAVSNVIFYAYPNGEDNHTIEILYIKKGLEITFTIQDTGAPFDPTAREDADITLSAEERNIGGLGIFMVKQIMTSVDYKREEGRNILTMKKTIE